jgi:DNA polymerase-3 subunit gamma/tau
VQRFDFRRMTVQEISGKLRTILEGDGRNAEPEAIDLIARLAAGGMRDAESMLDQLLATDTGALTADRVREVLGLVDEETVEAFLSALVRCDAVAGIELLDGMEELGRDLGAFAEQAIERLRVALVASLGRGDPVGLAAAGPEALGAAARRLASIDPRHPGPGGLRLQLELLLLAPPEARPHSRLESTVSIDRAAAAPRPAASQPPVAPDRPAPSEHPSARPAAGRKAAAASPAPESEPAAPVPSAAPEAEIAPFAPAAPANPEPEPVAPAARQAPRPRTGPTLALLLERWAEVVELVSKSPPTRPLIVACRPVSVDGSVVTLGFPEAQSFFKDVAERRRAILEDGVSRVLGIPVTVHCVAANVEVSPLPADPDSSRLLTEFRRIYGDDVVDVGDVG